MLDAVGYGTEVASTAAMAYQCLNGTTYSLVIADVRLPDGDGAQVADEAAERGFKTAILSGYVHQLTPAAKVRHEVMAKPMRPAELIATVRPHRLITRALAPALITGVALPHLRVVCSGRRWL